MTSSANTAVSGLKRGRAELIALLVGQMALLALTLDMMLPVLGEIASGHGVDDRGTAQGVVTAYLAGLALGHLPAGPLSDRVGRKPVLLGGLAVAGLGGLVVLFAPSFAALLAGRFLQGLGLAAPRVMVNAILRDRFVGAEMSRAFSLVIGTFLIVPALAPALGQGITAFVPWKGLFVALVAVTALMAAWAWARLPETRASGRPASFRATAAALRRNPRSLALMVATGGMFGCVLTYLASAEAVFMGTYDLEDGFALAFAVVCVGQILAFLANAIVVRRLGVQGTCGIGLACFAALAAFMAALCTLGQPPVEAYVAYLAVSLFCFGQIIPNLNAMAMEPLGDVAGSASSLLGFSTFGIGGGIAAVAGPMVENDVGMLPAVFLVLSLAVSGAFMATARSWR